ncbi:MAG: SDR family oxidoreductase [Candidatus Promineifilaceae bacterium]
MMNKIKKEQETLILVTGATGYVGGRLVPRLLDEGYRVRVLLRGGADRIAGRQWQDDVEVASGDVLQPDSLKLAMKDVDITYYLIHSMRDSSEFRDRDLQAALNFGEAARSAGIKRIVYLGGLGDSESELSEHLQSRQETGDALRRSGIPVTEFRAGVIVGSGSLSFEMVRHLTERLPAMICPRWLYVKTHPIAVRDVLSYLVSTLSVPESSNEIIEIGGADLLTYADMMKTYARLRGLRRIIIPVPVLTPRLSSYWAHWVTPIPASIARPLINGLRYELAVRDDKARVLFPDIEPIDYEMAVSLALERIDQGQIESLWSDAFASSKGDVPPVYLTQEQGMQIERRSKIVPAPQELVFQEFTSLGGDRGWPPYNWLWRIRGAIDRIIGGVGLRRSRRDQLELRQGEALDFWRVEEVRKNELLRLRAEMKMPGKGWLQFEASSTQDGDTELTQIAYFAPKGLSGLLYWHGLYPVHAVVFSGMLEFIANSAEERAAALSSASLVQSSSKQLGS